jgi:hypothetical protein
VRLKSALIAGLSFALPVILSGTAADTSRAAQSEVIPALQGMEFGWLADTELLPPLSGPGPVTFDKTHPYVRNNTVGQPTFRIGDLSNPILQPWVVDRMKRDNDEVLAGKVAFTARASCWPAGVPGFLVFGEAARTVYFLQAPKEVVMINEGDQQVRHVYLNATHSARPKSSWYGESVGHYENGDTLVVDTIGLNDRSFIDNYRTPHSDQLHVIERWKLSPDGKSVGVDIRVDDPGAFTMPWNARQIYQKAPQGQMSEMVCAENNPDYFNYHIVPVPTALRPDF